jgi:uncharacterized cupredoxin-like copper-binding protein
MRTFRVQALGTCLCVILTACAARSQSSTSVHVTMTDFAFMPNSFVVPAGQQIEFSASDTGAVAHSFLIMQLGHDVKGHFTTDDQAHVYWEQAEVAPGQSIHTMFTAPAEPGTYQIVCANGGHFEAGMVARLVVISKP